jgi:hypothetical protein
MKKVAFLVGCMVSVGGLAAIATMGCGGVGQTGTGTGGASGACEAGTFRDCDCETGGTGTQTCTDSKWGACVDCSNAFDAGSGSGGSDAAPMCGDNVCNGTETCVNCPADCGDCPACALAPSCTGASSVPSSPMALASFNNDGQTMYTSGVGLGPPIAGSGCSDPLLKMRVSQVLVHKNGAPGSLEMFCLVQADDGQSSQLMLTPDYMNLSDNNPPLILSPAAGTFWGQAVNGIKLSQFNITVTYQCFMVLTPGALQSALTAISQFAGAAAGIPGNPYGWAFGLGGAAAAAGAALAAVGSGATPLLNVQQTIDQSALLPLTNGDTWAIEQTGSTKADGDCGFFSSCDWDWELDVEAWGCAAPKGQTPM